MALTGQEIDMVAPEHGRELRVVDALSVRWGWALQDSGKAVFAIFTREG
jgi:hypothetical protein